MAWNGSGTYTRTNGVNSGTETWQDDAAEGANILASRHDTHDQDLATAISACLTQNNESKPTANFVPNANGLYSLGSSAVRWSNVFADSFTIGSSGQVPSIVTKMSVLLTLTVSEGLVVETQGFHSAGDGGGGTFYYSASEDRANHDGGTIIDPTNAADLATWDASAKTTWFTAGAGSGCWKRVYTDLLNVKWFGGKGDGAEDDTKSVQETIDNGNTFLPDGNYLVTGLTFPSDRVIRGQSRENTRIYCAVDSAINLFSCATISNVSGEYDENIEIRDLMLDHNRTSIGVAEISMTILLVGTRNFLLDNVHIKNPNADGIYSNYAYGGTGHVDNQPKNIRVNNCRFTGSNYNRNGISIISGDIYKITNCVFDGMCRDNMPGAIDMEPNNSNNQINDVQIDNCSFEDCKASIVSDYSPGDSNSFIDGIQISNIKIKNSSPHTTSVPTEFFGHTGMAMAHCTDVNINNVSAKDTAHASFWFSKIDGLNMHNIRGVAPTSPLIVRDTTDFTLSNFYLETTNSTTFTSVVSNGIYMRYETTGAGHTGVRRAKIANGVINCSDGTPTTNSAILGEGNVQDVDIDGVLLMGGWANGIVQSDGSSGDALRWTVNARIEDGNSMTPFSLSFDAGITESGNGPWVVPGHTNGVESFSASSAEVISNNLGKLATAQMRVSYVDNQTAGLSAKRTANNQFTITASAAITGDVYWEIAHP